MSTPHPSDQSAQLETQQAYESAAPATEDDKNQEILRREFPNIDSSLIAALYGDSKNLSATREMLYELSRPEDGNEGQQGQQGQR
jgi:hypothetical protein